MRAHFGTAGNSVVYTQTVSKSSLKAPEYLGSLGLDRYEYQCGKGVHVGMETAQALGRAAREWGITLSLHAPYFINLANPDPVMGEKTVGYVIAACQVAQWMGAERVVIHAGALMGRSRPQALEIARKSLLGVLAACDEAGYGGIALCPETMGKINQLGDLDEVLELCTLDRRLIPCIDFGHLYARSLGKLEGESACQAILDRMEQVLGEERAARFHSHFSHIEFTPGGGEKRHLTFGEGGFGPDWTPLARAVAQRGWGPTFICESAGTQSEDAVEMQRVYRQQRALLRREGENAT